ncbi:hypothetical protein MMC29_004632 [Sticta canariensis]|nr:hypothetical protein [Sticta canariensis]
MSSLVLLYIAAFRLAFAKPILDPSASLPLLTPLDSHTIEQLDLNPTSQYSQLSAGSSSTVASPINQDNPDFIGKIDLALTGQVKGEVTDQVTASAGLSDPVIQDNDFSGQEVPEQVVSGTVPSKSVIQGGDSANQILPVLLESTIDPSGSIFQDSDSSKEQYSRPLDLSGSVVDDSDSSDQNPDERAPSNDLSFTVAHGGHTQSHMCSSNRARSVERQPKKRNPAEFSRPKKAPATSRGPKPPKPQPQPIESPAQVPEPAQAQQPVPVPEPVVENKDQCYYVPTCEDINGQPMRVYCCPYVQRIGYDDRHVSTRAGCTDCSYQSLLFISSIWPNT